MIVIEIENQKIAGYTTGDLASRLRRKPLSIRLWERKGWIPPPLFRTSRGWRVYTSEEMDAIEKYFRSEVTPGKAITPTDFPRFVKEAFVQIHAKLKKRFKTTIEKRAVMFNTATLEEMIGLTERMRK